MEKLRLSQHSVGHKVKNYSDISKEVAREFKEHGIECFASAPKLTSVIRRVDEFVLEHSKTRSLEVRHSLHKPDV